MEAVFVVSIAGILVGMATLALPQIVSRLRLFAAAHEVVETLHTARVRSVEGTRQHRVTFAVGSSRFVLERREEDGSWRSIGGERRLPPGISIQSANSGAEFLFSARGECENGTIVLANSFGAVRRVIINQRGRVRVE